MNDTPAPEIALLLRLLDQAFDKKSWHGPNLRGSIRGLTAEQAGWRPRPGRHSIADVVAHTAYWKYAVRRKLRGDQRGSFGLKGSNWFRLPDPLTEADWRQLVELLTAEHWTLRAAVAAVDPVRLDRPIPPGRTRAVDLIQGIAAHDLYHAGQVQVLKRLQK
jgi:hypothetical protein